MHIMLTKINKQKASGSSSIPWITNYSPRFRQVCFDALHSLLINTDKIIPVEGDCHKLYLRIIEGLKVLEITFHHIPPAGIQTSADVIDNNGEILTLSVGHGSQSYRFTIESRADIETIKDLIAIVEGFKPFLI